MHTNTKLLLRLGSITNYRVHLLTCIIIERTVAAVVYLLGDQRLPTYTLNKLSVTIQIF